VISGAESSEQNNDKTNNLDGVILHQDNSSSPIYLAVAYMARLRYKLENILSYIVVCMIPPLAQSMDA